MQYIVFLFEFELLMHDDASGTTYFLLFSRTLKAHLRTPITQKGKALSADQHIHTARVEM